MVQEVHGDSAKGDVSALLPEGTLSRTTGVRNDHCSSIMLGGLGPGSVTLFSSMSFDSLRNSCNILQQSAFHAGHAHVPARIARQRTSVRGHRRLVAYYSALLPKAQNPLSPAGLRTTARLQTHHSSHVSSSSSARSNSSIYNTAQSTVPCELSITSEAKRFMAAIIAAAAILGAIAASTMRCPDLMINMHNERTVESNTALPPENA